MKDSAMHRCECEEAVQITPRLIPARHPRPSTASTPAFVYLVVPLPFFDAAAAAAASPLASILLTNLCSDSKPSFLMISLEVEG